MKKFIVCSDCDGIGSSDADFDYELERYVPYGICSTCDGSGYVEEDKN